MKVENQNVDTIRHYKEQSNDELWPNEDQLIYLPNETIRTFESACFKIWKANKELHRLAEKIKQNHL